MSWINVQLPYILQQFFINQLSKQSRSGFYSFIMYHRDSAKSLVCIKFVTHRPVSVLTNGSEQKNRDTLQYNTTW